MADSEKFVPNTEARDPRFSELLQELESCREDDRNTANQVVSVIAATGTILGIVLTATMLNKIKNVYVISKVATPKGILDGLKNILHDMIIPSRICFWLTALIFIVAFLYITTLGIGSVLRYHYIRNLQERILDILPGAADDKERNFFVHYNEYKAPVMTYNIKHTGSSVGLINLLAYYGSIISCAIFCIVVLAFECASIQPRRWYDYGLLVCVVLLIFFVVFLFWLVNKNAHAMFNYAINTAHENVISRSKGLIHEAYAGAEGFRRLLVYCLLPRREDMQKPIMILAGFLISFLMERAVNPGVIIPVEAVFRLLFITFLFEYLIYGIRYQINDIRGFDEDKDLGKTNRLWQNDRPKGLLIRRSLEFVVIKAAATIFLFIICREEMRVSALWCLVFLIAISVLYEAARELSCNWAVMILVSLGYPMRFYLGMLAFLEENVNTHLLEPAWICIFLVALCVGGVGATLSFARDIENCFFRITFPKSYYNDIRERMKDAYWKKKASTEKEKHFLRKKAQKPYTLIWNIYQTIGLTAHIIFGLIVFGSPALWLIPFDIVFAVAAFNGNDLFSGCSVAGSIASTIVAVRSFFIEPLLAVHMILLMGIGITYYVLREDPEKLKGKDFKEYWRKLVNGMLGCDVYSLEGFLPKDKKKSDNDDSETETAKKKASSEEAEQPK